MITLSNAGPQAALTAAMSARTLSVSPSFSAPTSITMSTSVAPAATTQAVSFAFTSVGIAPSGKPTTEQVATPEPASASATVGTQVGLTQTEKKWFSRASRQKRRTSARRASGFRMVWSMKPWRSATAMSMELSGGLRPWGLCFDCHRPCYQINISL